MTEPTDPALEAEFDTVAAWTEHVVTALGPDYAIPAACRGSAHPAWLTWIAVRLAVDADDRFLDCGAGLGGPAAWLSQRVGREPVLAEPMIKACEAARRLFKLPIVAAWSQALPFHDGAFDAAWCLGVLCTTTEKTELLHELRRVLRDQGRLGLLVLVRISAELPEPPEGNDFPTETSLLADLTAAGFVVDEQIEAGAIEGADEDWHRKAAEVEQILEDRYGGRPAWQLARDQENRIGRLLRDGHLQTWLITARAR
jgi:SAM-dependent methyltransferase